MTSYELLDFYEEILNKMEGLNVYSGELSKLINDINIHRDNLLNLIYPDGLKTNDGNFINSVANDRGTIIQLMQKFSMEFDILENHQKLIRTRDEVESIFKKYSIVLDEEKNKIRNLLEQYDKLTSNIYQYVKTRSNSIIVELLNEVSLAVNNYDKFTESYKNIREFMLKTENKIEENENEKTLKVHFYDEHLNPEYFITNIQAIRDSYGILSQILNIPLSEHELKVIKIESGSLLGKFIGCDKIMDALSFLIKKITELVFNKYTFEGKVLRQKAILDLIKEDAEVVAKYKELGFDISFTEDITKYHYQLVKSIGKLVGQTTRIKINNEEFSIENSLKQKYLSESKALMIEDHTALGQEESDK